MLNILIIGSTGTFAKPICKALLDKKHAEHFRVTIMARPQTLQDKNHEDLLRFYKMRGATLISGDCLEDKTEDLVQTIRDAKSTDLSSSDPPFDVLISVVGDKALLKGQQKLIEAAEKAGIPWMIPSEFGMATRDYGRGNPVGYDVKLDIQEALKESSLHWTCLFTGPCVELFVPESPFVSVKNKTVTAPDFKVKFTTTLLRDVGGLLAEVLRKAEQGDNSVKDTYLYMGAEELTYEDVAKKLEKHYQCTFKRQKPDLKVYEDKDSIQAKVYQLFSSEKGIHWDLCATWNRRNVPEYKMTSLEDLLKSKKLQD